ncbi:MAG: MFS transporter [Thermoproteota archaeon]
MSDVDGGEKEVRGRWGLHPSLVIVMTIFIDITGFGMVIPLLPFYAETFQAGSLALGVLVASFAIMQFIFSPILGRISDNVGRKPVLLLSILISMLSFVIFAVANSFLVLLLSRIIAGMATETSVAQAYTADLTEEEDRTKGMGRVAAANGMGFIIGPAIGGFLSVYGFSVPGFAAAGLTFLNFLFVLVFLPESARRSQDSEVRKPERRKYLPNLTRGFSTKEVGMGFLVFFLVILAFSTVPVIVPLLGISYFDLGTTDMSYIFVYIGLVQVVLQGFLMERIAKKFGEGRLMRAGPLVMASGILVMPLIPNFLVFLTANAMMATGVGIMRTVVPSFISKRTGVGEQGGALGMTQSVSSIARVPGPLVGGVFAEFGGLPAPFFLSTALLAVAFIVSWKACQICTPA